MRALKRKFDLTTMVLALFALPFVLGTCYMTYRSLWFQFAATRAEGAVIEVAAGTPTLIVEYSTGRGATLTTQSAGSDLYKGISRGDRLIVFFDPQNPADARIDLFVENWLLPILTLIPAAILLLVMFGLRSGFSMGRLPRLKDGGIPVKAQFTRIRVAIDMESPSSRQRLAGSISIEDDGVNTVLVHNGVARDPFDPEVQRELGLSYSVEATWNDPKSGRLHVFESEPLPTNPQSQLKGRDITVYIDPKRPERYRMELAFQQKAVPMPDKNQGFRGNV